MSQDYTQKIDSIITAMTQGDDAGKLQANIDATGLSADAVQQLAKIYTGNDRVRSKTAGEMLKMMTHHAARPGAKLEAKKMTGQLAKLAGSQSPKSMRLLALDMLGYVGGPEAIPVLSRQLSDPDVQDQARMSLERIPSPAADTALRKARAEVPADYRESIDLSLKHREQSFKSIGTDI
jgi:HEAT repeat protein